MAPRLPQKEGGSLLPSHHDPEKARLQAHYTSTSPSLRRQEEDDRPRDRMPSPKHLLTTLVVALLVTLGLAAAVVPRDSMPCHDMSGHDDHRLAPDAQGPLPEPDSRSFGDLLEQVSPHSLHRLLSTYFPRRYRHGVFESEHRAMEAVHADDPDLASSIVKIAKRQDNNSTDSPTDSSSQEPDSNTPTPTPTPTDNPDTDTPTPTPTPTDNPDTDTPTPTPTPTNNPDTNTTPTPTPTQTNKDDTTTTTPPANTNQSPSTSTPPAPTTSTTTQRTTSPTTTTTKKADDDETTTTKGTKTTSVAMKKTSTPVTATITSTKPNGEVTLVTSTSYVEFDVPATETGEAGSLQTEDAAAVPNIPALPALAGALLGGLALL